MIKDKDFTCTCYIRVGPHHSSKTVDNERSRGCTMCYSHTGVAGSLESMNGILEGRKRSR